jgi:hypothetical protein
MRKILIVQQIYFPFNRKINDEYFTKVTYFRLI